MAAVSALQALQFTDFFFLRIEKNCANGQTWKLSTEDAVEKYPSPDKKKSRENSQDSTNKALKKKWSFKSAATVVIAANQGSRRLKTPTKLRPIVIMKATVNLAGVEFSFMTSQIFFAKMSAEDFKLQYDQKKNLKPLEPQKTMKLRFVFHLYHAIEYVFWKFTFVLP